MICIVLVNYGVATTSLIIQNYILYIYLRLCFWRWCYKITKANMFLIYYLHTAVHSFIAAKLYEVNQKLLQYNQIHWIEIKVEENNYAEIRYVNYTK